MEEERGGDHKQNNEKIDNARSTKPFSWTSLPKRERRRPSLAGRGGA